jgi:hypothetical protein
MLDEVNMIFKQVGMHFSLGAGIMNVTNDVWAKRGLTHGSVMSEIRNIMPGTDGVELYFVPGLDVEEAKAKGEALGKYNAYGIIVKDSANAKTLAHEIGHACGWCDIYTYRDEFSASELLSAPRQEWLPHDWNNGTGERFYPSMMSQEDIIFRLLMYGHGSETKSDIPLGFVHGLPNTGSAGLLNVGRNGVMSTSPHNL